MKVLDITQVSLDRLDFSTMTQHPWQEYEMVDGYVGVSTIIRKLAIACGQLTIQERDEDEMPLRMLVGMGWEAMAAQLYPGMRWQPPALKVKGVSLIGHPDGYSVDVEWGELVEEFKYTALSIRRKGGKPDEYKNILDKWMWMSQLMTYIKMRQLVKKSKGVRGRLHICYAMGNYTKFTLDEVYMRYVVEYTQDELDKNWNMIVNNK